MYCNKWSDAFPSFTLTIDPNYRRQTMAYVTIQLLHHQCPIGSMETTGTRNEACWSHQKLYPITPFPSHVTLSRNSSSQIIFHSKNFSTIEHMPSNTFFKTYNFPCFNSSIYLTSLRFLSIFLVEALL